MRTLLRTAGAWALGIGLMFIALQNAVASDRTILVFGDSLSAAHGLRPEQGWVALLIARLRAQGYGYQVINASVSGETTHAAGSLACRGSCGSPSPASSYWSSGPTTACGACPLAPRAAAPGRHDPAGRERARAGAARRDSHPARITGRATPSSSRPCIRNWRGNSTPPWYPSCCREWPSTRSLMQQDGLHPNARGEPLVLDTLWPYLKPMLKKSR